MDLCPGENPQHPFIPGSALRCLLSAFHTSQVPRDFASSFPNHFSQLSLFDLLTPLLRGDSCLLPCSSRRFCHSFLAQKVFLQQPRDRQGLVCSPGSAQPALGGRGQQCLNRSCASFLPPALAEISLPACAMLCCFCLPTPLGFSFADGFRLFLLVTLVLLVGIFTLCLLLAQVVFALQLQPLAAVDLGNQSW